MSPRRRRGAHDLLRDNAGSMLPVMIAILIGGVLMTGVIIRVGSAAFVKDKAQTAADAAALTLAGTGSIDEARRVAYLNGAQYVGSKPQGRAVVVEVKTFKTIFRRTNIPGLARAAAVPGLVQRAPGQAPPLLNVDPVFGPCPVPTADWRRFAAPIDGRATKGDLDRLPAFLRQHGYEVRDDEVFCRPTGGNVSLYGTGSRLGALGFAVEYGTQLPTESFKVRIAEGDAFEQVKTLDKRDGPRLVPLEENLGDGTP